jgi:hypothetical protein
MREPALRRTIELPDQALATIGSWVELPERASIVALTPSGLVRIKPDGSLQLVSSSPVSAIARDPATTHLLAAGATLEIYSGKSSSPVSFVGRHSRSRGDVMRAGGCIDMAASATTWFLLFNAGRLLTVDSRAGRAELLDTEDGIPWSASRVVVDRRSGAAIVGSTDEGAVLVRQKPVDVEQLHSRRAK